MRRISAVRAFFSSPVSVTHSSLSKPWAFGAVLAAAIMADAVFAICLTYASFGSSFIFYSSCRYASMLSMVQMLCSLV